MAIDYAATAQGLANLLFVKPNRTASLSVTDLSSIAQAVDQQMTADLSAFTAAMPSTFQSLTGDQQNEAMAFVAMKRAGLA